MLIRNINTGKYIKTINDIRVRDVEDLIEVIYRNGGSFGLLFSRIPESELDAEIDKKKLSSFQKALEAENAGANLYFDIVSNLTWGLENEIEYTDESITAKEFIKMFK